MDSLPKFQLTSNDTIPNSVNDVRNAFHSQKTKPLEFRKQQLRRLYWSIKDNYDALLAACKKDIGKGTFEAGFELEWCMNDCIYVANKLNEWAKDEKAPEIPLMNAMLRPKIRNEPLGMILIIGTYNFPLILLFPPLIGAIAAGNTVIIKPSENAPNVAAVAERVITSTLDPSCFRVIQGAIPETTTLLDQKWDKIFYTGGATVGTIVAKKAAETLTPYTLELGGKNPAIVTKNANIRKAAHRLLWGKIQNAGQVCISQNYTLVERPVLDAFVAEMKGALAEFFPSGTRNTDDYGRLVNSKQLQRAKSILDSTKGKIIVGGTIDESDCYFEPTIILLDSTDDPMLQEESFAPLMPVIPFDDLNSAIATANSMESTPLGLYPFGSKVENEKILNEIRSGGASVNDAWIHGSIPTLAFGGVGDSGQGAYRGKASFDCFSHRRSITTTPWWAEKLIAMRYPPYAGKLEQFKRLGSLKPNFDRDGKVKVGLLRCVHVS
ncbi:uncharacterized protein KY384_006181 [Bacidia gigantensis]|uniref:uncharacterized protein n=1 Tax=Bacidia gigantensis TaxID=2732470 RepID=UPI001D03FB5C|nr:uncharacterized protein KY384_006181 [Bacidia gigantensis]KAG8529544.1 hypothetical protein KY384_006181 [Bacidia gigantensis]